MASTTTLTCPMHQILWRTATSCSMSSTDRAIHTGSTTGLEHDTSARLGAISRHQTKSVRSDDLELLAVRVPELSHKGTSSSQGEKRLGNCQSHLQLSALLSQIRIASESLPSGGVKKARGRKWNVSRRFRCHAARNVYQGLMTFTWSFGRGQVK